ICSPVSRWFFESLSATDKGGEGSKRSGAFLLELFCRVGSSWCGETTGTIRGAAPFESAVFVQPSGINAIKAKLINEVEDKGLGCRVVSRNRQSDAAGSVLRPT